MSEADKIIKNLKNSRKKVEEFYMSNKTSDKNVANDSVIAHKFAVMQQQINEKDKRIQELEEKVETKQKFIIMANEVIENSIPNQVVIDKIEGLRNDIKLGNCRYPYINEHKIDVLQELLGGEK